ncbi:SNF2 family domain-containing protein [Colletotrichum truncatum]|uniref:SNF2 family domain-containing protein n=1 Tax=Colletotrichum truncatum TaxID=5467 RepID=A0ACC3YES1_COLTU|nr:SNF2 family domain-containing protein [Colletotrichum truncatum]KAF6783250.1 SNF2 family domain-containing protein [Colletotrichum truncatum]
MINNPAVLMDSVMVGTEADAAVHNREEFQRQDDLSLINLLSPISPISNITSDYQQGQNIRESSLKGDLDDHEPHDKGQLSQFTNQSDEKGNVAPSHHGVFGHEDSLMSDTEPEDELDDTSFQSEESSHESSPEPVVVKKKIKHTTGPRLKNAKEYNAKRQIEAETRLKGHIRRELAKKKANEDPDSDIEPPKARKKPMPSSRAKKTMTDNVFEEDLDGPVHHDGALPSGLEKKVANELRRKQITAHKNQGSNNRRSNTQADDLKEATKLFGHGRVECLEGNKYQIKGTNIRLHQWQLNPVAWMVKREVARTPPFGGILADAPGMGKTVMSLSCIAGNPPIQKDIEEYSRTTLIVLPKASVRDQWVAEVKQGIKSVRTYCYTRKSHHGTGARLADYDIILTTFTELLAYPSDEKVAKLQEIYAEDEIGFRKALGEIAGEVFNMKFYRVILDETHEIKNPKTKTYKACYALVAKSIWGLSATPLVNSSKELFPYVKLLRVEGISDHADFKIAYGEKHTSADKVDALINLITYRRTKNDEFLGEKILQGLPPFESEQVWVELSPEERFLYNFVTQHYDSVSPEDRMMQMSRQRQMISHPYNIERAFRNDFGFEALESVMGGLLALQRINADQALATEGATPSGDTASANDSVVEADLLGPLFSNSEQPISMEEQLGMSSLFRYANNEAVVRGQTCGCCQKSQIQEPWVINACGHMFCYSCISRTWLHGAKCPACNNPYNLKGGIRPVSTLTTREEECDKKDSQDAFEMTKRACDSPSKKSKRKAKSPSMRSIEKTWKTFIGKRHGADANGVLPALADDDKAFLKIALQEHNNLLPLSAKLRKARDIMLEWTEKHPNDKFIVFHEFVKTSVILGIILNNEGIPFVYLNGKVTSSQKNRAIQQFKENPEVRALVSSGKCGGQALNLTVANRVLSVDMWWNDSMDEQAAGRVNRIGQRKQTYAVTIKARDTIDDHIVNMQEKKSTEIAHILQDDNHETKLFSEWEIMKYTAPQAWKTLTKRLIKEIREEDGMSEDSDNSDQE